MNRTFLSVMLCASSIAACGGSKETAATTTATPPSMTAAAFPATLLAEQDLTTQTATAYSLDWSLDGEVLAVASGVEVTVLPKDLTKALAVVKPGKGALAAALSPDGATLATVGGLRDRTIEIQGWDSRASPDVQRISATSDQYAVSWSPDGSLLATLANDRT
ncbi:MAG: hypothetical protein ABI894_14210, partial [Ilumatobacteraceae bacterium]